VIFTWNYYTGTTYRTAVGERRVIILADGSKVSLDAASEVMVRYTDAARALSLGHGRAKFEVAHDTARPFTVKVADKIVRATGTVFSVEMLRGSVQVILYEGHVNVLNTDEGAATSAVALRPRGDTTKEFTRADALLTPGRELDVPIARGFADVAAVDPVRSTAWESGQLVFIQEPLTSAIERVNRYANRKVQIADQELINLKVDGVFAAGDSAAFLEGISAIFHLTVRETPEASVLVRRR
jgi:transmembrane sensor